MTFIERIDALAVAAKNYEDAVKTLTGGSGSIDRLYIAEQALKLAAVNFARAEVRQEGVVNNMEC
jgi:hypothetical protein